MFDVALCIAQDHDSWLTLLAVLLCGVGAFAVVQLYCRGQETSGLQRFGWLFLASVGAGATIWCTHFIAMLAFRAGVPVTLDPVLTNFSLIIAVAGTGIGFAVAAWRRGVLPSAIGGALIGMAISAMHFTGMKAYRVDGLIEWRWGYVAVAVACAILFSAASLATLDGERVTRKRVVAGTGLFVVAIALLHFVAMTALHIIPLHLAAASLDAGERQALGMASGLVGLVVIATGIFAALIDRGTRSEAMQQLHHMAMNDALTGLPNRVSFQRELTRQLAAARATGEGLGLVAIDLNRFKEINDVHGHKAGDEVLVRMAERLQQEMIGGAFLARLGGDEFVAVARFRDHARLVSFVARVEEAIRAPLSLERFDATVGASIGVAVFPDDAEDGETLTNNADLAMYRAKGEGALGPCFYDAMLDEAIRERRELAVDLRMALSQEELDVHYQVQASVTTQQVTGYEALLRWTHPTRGPISPAAFIPIAEENGLILPLGEWVLRRACRDAMQWPHDSKVSVNVSPLQLAHAELPRDVHQILIETGLPPRRLEIELTESAIMANRERALHVLRQIKALGVGVALDDFGTGYSSLETLRAFPFDKIKLDRLFVAELEASPETIAIIRAVLALGRSLSIPVLAEGIETDGQFRILQREGCDEAQGFLLGYPQPVTSGVHMPAVEPTDDQHGAARRAIG